MNYIDSIVKICIRVIPTASALPLSTHVKSNVMRSKPTFALIHMVHTPPGQAFSPQLIRKYSYIISGKQNFISINNEIITVRSKPRQIVLVDQKQSIFSHCRDTGPILARWGIKTPVEISLLQGQFGILLKPVACKLHGGCCRGRFRTIRSNTIHQDRTRVNRRFQIGSRIYD